MALYTSTNEVSGITPDDFGQLVVQPVQRESVAYQTSTVVVTGSTRYNIPIVTEDPSAGWFAEGAEIAPDDPSITELTVTPKKVAGLTIISNELARDSDPSAQTIVGQGLARDIARKIDAAFFSNTTANGPSGLLSLTGTQTVDTGAAITSFDPFAEAISKAEDKGAKVGYFVTTPAIALAVAKLKQASGSNMPMLGTTATDALDRRILGVPLIVSPYVGAGDIWAIPTESVYVVQNGGAELEADSSAYFTSYRTAVRAVMRVGFGFANQAAIVRLYDAA